MADILEVQPVTVRPDPKNPGKGATDPLPTRTVPLPDEPGLDMLFVHERKKADDAERQERLIGRYLNDQLIQATQQGIEAVQQGAQAVGDAVKPALDKAGKTVADDVLPIVSDPRFEMLGTGVTTGGAITGNPAAALTGIGMIGMAKVGKGLLRQRFNVEEVMERALSPSPLAERVSEAINTRTPVLKDEDAKTQAKKLVKGGGVSLDTLANYAPGTAALSAPQALAAQEVLTTAANDFRALGEAALASGDEQQIAAALTAFDAMTNPMAGYAGAATTTGQTFRLLSSEQLKTMNLMFERASKTSAGMQPREILERILSVPATPNEMMTAINNTQNPTWRDAWQHLLINAMLTPASDFINFTATMSMIPAHVAARGVAARTGKVAQMLGGKAGVLVGEDEAMIHGLYSSFWDSVKLAGRVLKTARPEIGPAAVREEALKDNPITANAMFGYSPTARKMAGVQQAPTYDSASYPMLSRAGAVSQAINFFGVATGLPGRLMLTGDQFVQSLAMNAEMHAQVYRKATEQAVREGLSEKDFYKSYRPLWRSMQQRIPDDIRAAGEEFSLEVSLNKKLGPLGSQVLALREKANEFTGIGGTVALPFFKTLVNSAKATWEFSPLAPASSALGLVSKQFRDDMFGQDPVKRDLAVGKWAFGSMLMSSMLWAAFNGRLTGRGPDSKALRDAGYEAEGLPDSFVYNTDTGERVQINRLGVLSNLAGMAADAAEIWPIADDQTKADIAQLLTTAYVGNLSFDFMLNSAQVVQALANGVKKKEDLVVLAKAVGGSMIPLSGTIRSAEKLLSDEPLLVKDARDTMDKILARFPGYDSLAKQFGMDPVPVKRNQFGDAVKQPRSAFGTEWFNPMYISAPSTDPVMQRLATVEKELKLEIGPPAMTTGKNNLPMTAQEYDKYQWLAGKRWRERASAIIDILEDKNTLDQVKRNLIETHLRLARQTAQRELLGSEPDLVDSLVQDTQTRYSTLRTPKKTVRQPLTLNPE